MRKGVLSIGFLLITAMTYSQVKPIKITELEKIISESKSPLIVNFWATYCVPCLQEIPYFREMADKYKSKGLKIIFVSLDLKEAYPKQVSTIAKKLKFTPPFLWLNETDADYFCPKVDSSWSGGLPSSLFVNHTTGYRKFFEDKISKEKLEKQIREMLSL